MKFSFSATLAAMLALTHPPAEAADGCPPLAITPLSLPRSRDAVAANQELVIVAVGSSSTQGWMSSSIAHSYPALLQAQLTTALPQAHVAVLNRGVGGQDAAEEVPRLDVDVVAAQPTLVIWQVGANGALRNSDPKIFTQLVTAGVNRLKAAKLDVVLMDNQQSPMILAAPEHALINETLADIAKSTGVGLFSRNDLMDRWASGGFPISDFISPDGLHHSDHGYACITESLAGSIAAALKQPANDPKVLADSKPVR